MFPNFHHERRLTALGHTVIGVDEVGCGCLFGPVVSAAVCLPLNSRIGNIRDSKLLAAEKREEIFKRFIDIGICFTVGMATAEEIDKLNIRRASILAMKRAVDAFFGATFALVDAWKIPDLKISQLGIIHGDRLVKSIAAASIIAKVVRDRLMREYDKDFSGYGLARHKGYATKIHRDAIRRLGTTPLHRKSFLSKF